MKANNLIPMNSEKDITISLPNSIANSVTKQDLNVLAAFLQNKLPEMLSESFEEIKASNEMQTKNTNKRFDAVEKKVGIVQETIKSKHVSPEDLDALKSLVHNKAEALIEKQKGVQLSINVFLEVDREKIKTYKQIYNQERGRIKSRIWVELNKDCLGRKGNAPKNRIPATQVEKAFDFVRSWGGFSV